MACQALRSCPATGRAQARGEQPHQQETPDATLELLVLTPAFGSSPQPALAEPGMGAHLLLRVAARLLLHELSRLPEGHRLSRQALDWERLDELR